ncbi:MAG: hypothetical protein GY786_22565 [Proteobacteria bacterium]|nr:hypothetical protein [Pseudomonadota bacterium]
MSKRSAPRCSQKHKNPKNQKERTNPNAVNLSNSPRERPRFEFLDAAAIETLKTRAFEILERHGVIFNHPEATKGLLKAGARQGNDANRLRLPRPLVEEALVAAPKEVSLCGKKPSFDIHLPRKDGGFIMRTGTGAHGYIDPENGQYRNLDLPAVAEIAAVGNDLDEVGFIAHPFVYGVPELTSDIHGLAALIQRTNKHVWIQPYNKENIEYLMRIASIAAGGEQELRQRPLASCITCSFSPLEFKFMDTEVILQARKYGMPVHACSLPSAGGTAPLSVSGSVLMAAAEILAIVTTAHVLAPNLPVIATPLMFTLDMRTGKALQSSVESLQAASMSIQLMKQGFGLPTHTYGAGSDTPDVDVQSMAERSLLAQNVAISGADILGGVGQLECATVFSPVQAVLDNEVGGIMRKFIQIPEVSDESLNWNEISRVEAGGHFLGSPHTLKYCRMQHRPKAFLRQDRNSYEAADRRNAFDQAREMALESIRNAPPEGVLGEAAKNEIAQVVIDADRYILDRAASNRGAVPVV